MAEVTPNLGLKKPLESEFVSIQTLNENMDKVDQSLGAVSELPTTAKNAAGAIAEIYDQLADKPHEQLTLTPGVQIVQGGDVPAILHPTMQGRTLVNLLGREGLASRSSFSISNFSVTTGTHYLFAFDISNFEGSGVVGIAGDVSGGLSGTGLWFATMKAPDPLFNAATYIYSGTPTFKVEKLRLYEITSAEKENIDSLASAEAREYIEANYPYVDDMKHVNAVYIENKGKNLLPPFSEWAQYAGSSVITGSYSVTLNAGSTIQFDVPCIPNQVYVFSLSNMGGKISLGTFDENMIFLSQTGFVTTGSINKTTEANAKYLRAVIDTTGLSAKNFSYPMLNIGSEALPFEPQKPSYLYLPDCNLRSTVAGGIVDRLYTDGKGKPRVTRRFREMTLDGSLAWTMAGDFTGYKFVEYLLPIASTGVNNEDNIRCVKYDGKILVTSGITTGSDQVAINSSNKINFGISIADTDSGWGESYTPTVDEIKAYFWGWRYLDRNAASGVPGTKRWVPVGSNVSQTTTSTTSSSTNSLVVANAASFSVGDALVVNGFTPSITGISGSTLTLDKTVNVTSGDYVYKVTGLALVGGAIVSIPTEPPKNYKPYRLMYQLAQSVDEPVTYEGSLLLHEGDNQIEVGTGVVIREPSTALPLSGDGNRYINEHEPGLETSLLKYRTNNLIAVYRASVKDNRWKIVKNHPHYAGGAGAYLRNTDYDYAPYSVTYLALDTYTLGVAPHTISVEYAPNIRESVESLVREVVEDRTETSVLQNTKAQKQQPQWIAPSLRNDWVDYGVSAISPTSYMKNEFGWVKFRGMIKLGAMTSTTILFVLPPGYRPKTQEQGIALFGGATGTPVQVVIASNGAVSLGYAITSNSWLDLSGISFRAEQ